MQSHPVPSIIRQSEQVTFARRRLPGDDDYPRGSSAAAGLL